MVNVKGTGILAGPDTKYLIKAQRYFVHKKFILGLT